MFEQKHIRIDSVFATVNSGTLWGSGSLDYDAGQLTNLDLSLHARKLHYNIPRQYSVTVQSLDLSLREAGQAYFLDGDIVLGDSRFIRTVQPREILTFITAIDRPREEMGAVLKKTRLNLRIRDNRQLWINNNLARIRMRSNITILGSLSDPILAGRLTAEEGYALYLDRRFTVKEGLISFVDAARINPEITLTAESTVKSFTQTAGTAYTVTLAIRGPLDQVSVDLKSEPPLDKADIVSMLTVGATRGQLMGGQLTGALQDRLLGLSSERISRYTAQRLGTLLNLDNVTIEGNLFNYQKLWGPQLIASRKLSNRMSITYRTTIGQFNDQGFRLDYNLSKYFLLAGTTNNSGQSGLDLKFRLRFK
ncbi:translocation/assembly module TamB domain-containing protein [Candidatus Neomarinimicrobiota bacterium]